MKKVIIVSKTHLDLGFTDYAQAIKNKYLDKFIPNAVDISHNVNSTNSGDKSKHFVWTTGSWLLCESLKFMTEENKQNLISALKRGDIAPHAMPFTTHTEILDEDTLDYGLSLVDTIDKIVGRKTIAAKMTDVPGHSIAIVPLLAKHGIKFLHIGVNGAATLPDVPNCFLWKYQDSEVVVVYSGDYGGEYKCEYTGDILYFDHTLDNHGTPSVDKIEQKFTSIANKYPDYEVTAGRMDDFAENLWAVKDKLPVIEKEIGDTWIHGIGSDSFKVAAFKELIRLKTQWLADGSLKRDSEEYKMLCDNLLCVAEHTWGGDVKIFFCDYSHYTRKKFDKARLKNKIRINPFGHPSCNFINFFGQKLGILKNDKYTSIEKSWQEQRNYLYKAVDSLLENHKLEAKKALDKLMPKQIENVNTNCQMVDIKKSIQIENNIISDLVDDIHNQNDKYSLLELNKSYNVGQWTLSINSNGGIGKLVCGDTVIIETDNAIAQYHSYSDSDYEFWLTHYTRNLENNKHWAVADAAKPNLCSVKNKYPQGLFNSKFVSGTVLATNISTQIVVNLTFDSKLSVEAGAPKNMQLVYCLGKEGLDIDFSWSEKPANRLPESVLFRLFPMIDESSNLTYFKIGKAVNPLDIVSKGNRKISAVEKISFEVGKSVFEIINLHSPLIEIGEDNILKFENKIGDFKNQGFSYILQNNIWGTNFPLWYEDNALFSFKIKKV